MVERAEAPALSVWDVVFAALVAISGFAVSAAVFYPGMATHDALAVYDQAYAGSFGDWQPPLMGLLWVWLERLFGYGPQAIFLPTIAAYWLGLAAVFLALRPSRSAVAWLVPLVGLLPPTFALIGTIWRDVIFSVLWLFGFGLVLLAAERHGLARLFLSLAAAALLLLGFALRPNALFAAAPMLIYLIWPRDWRWKRLLLLAVPACIALQGSAYLLNYGILRARQDHVLHSIFVFDLTGITHFSGQNVFPISWTPAEFEKLSTRCYNPAYWDSIWWRGCTFAMAKIDRNLPPDGKLFGSPRLRDAWAEAVMHHPLAYARHRLAYFRELLTGENMVMFSQYSSGQFRFMVFKTEAYLYLESGVLWLNHRTLLFGGLVWLALAVATGLAALRFSDGRAKAAVLALSTSGTIFTLTYLLFGVAAEYRYVYWTALSSLVATVIVLAKWAHDRRGPGTNHGLATDAAHRPELSSCRRTADRGAGAVLQ